MDAADHLDAALRLLGLHGDPEMARTGEQVAQLLADFAPTGTLPALDALPTTSFEVVILRDLPFYSLCAHHLLPFFGTCDLAYRPSGHIAGLGAFPRLLDALARRPQLQERLAAQLADEIDRALQPRAVVVRLRARQLCMEMRGARSSGSVEVVALRGNDDRELVGLLRS
jgi:GTP cyclohydrolase IA